ncbi:uncharacterized protein LOC116168140 [Photinus pyralis]|uniref:uncharacterized protein LOC116168140 n=1 Tax=Photinus pyralis TaxID=7054 RepID=UPI0012676A7C|nr:uncharacterized protein LOC116168140 [Photinus pyralis]
MQDKEVKEAVLGVLGAAGKVDFEPLKVAEGHIRIATIYADKTAAAQLNTLKRVWVGVASCRLSKRVEIIKCRKCWEIQEDGHKCREDVPREKRCFNCEEAGHLKNKCQNNKK